MIDSITKKGAFHRSMPQDYVVAEDIGTSARPMPFIAVADGCSAGRHSEIGAMLLTRAALAVAKDYYRLANPKTMGRGLQDYLLTEITLRLKETIKQLDLDLDDMIATLRVAYVVDNVLRIIGTGDGFQFLVTNSSGGFQMDQYEYEINAPFYHAYEIFDKVKEYDGIGINHLVQTHTDSANSTLNFSSILNSHHVVMQEYSLELYSDAMYFGLATDGLGTYMKEDGSNLAVKPETIVNQLSQIKQPAGEFLVRRFQRMDKELTSQGFVNQDDIGIAMISLFTYRETIKHNGSLTTEV